jgi:hypothetical protein
MFRASRIRSSLASVTGALPVRHHEATTRSCLSPRAKPRLGIRPQLVPKGGRIRRVGPRSHRPCPGGLRPCTRYETLAGHAHRDSRRPWMNSLGIRVPRAAVHPSLPVALEWHDNATGWNDRPPINDRKDMTMRFTATHTSKATNQEDDRHPRHRARRRADGHNRPRADPTEGSAGDHDAGQGSDGHRHAGVQGRRAERGHRPEGLRHAGLRARCRCVHEQLLGCVGVCDSRGLP